MNSLNSAVNNIDRICRAWPPSKDQLVELRGALDSTRAQLSSSGQLVGSLRQVVATNVIDRTFDDHRALLRSKLEEAENELRRLRSGMALSEIEAERDAAVADAAKLSLQVSQITSESVMMRREIDELKAQSLRPSEREMLLAVHFFKMMLHLVGMFSIGDMWQDAVGDALATSITGPWCVQEPTSQTPSRKKVSKQPRQVKDAPPPPPDPLPYGSGASSVSKMPILPRIPSGAKASTHRVAARLAKQ